MKKLILVFIIILSGCMVGPNYQKPDVDMPSEFVEEKPSEELTLSLKDWWKTFNDPTLDSLIDIAIENNLNLKIAIEKIEETRAFYRIKKADLFPEVDATASAIRYGLSKNLIQTSFFPKTSYNIFQAGFDATWEVDLFGRLRREKEAAFYEMQSKQEDMRDVYIILLSEVSRNYVDLCAIKNIMDVLSEKIEYQKTILNLISDRNQVGIDSRIETEQEIAVLNEDVETLIFYNTLLKQTAFKLAVLLGKHPEEVQDVVLKSTKIVDAVNKIKLGLPSEILRRRPDIKSAERRLAQSTAKVGAAIARFFPSFSLTGNTDLQVNKLNKFFSSNSFSWSLGSLMN